MDLSDTFLEYMQQASLRPMSQEGVGSKVNRKRFNMTAKDSIESKSKSEFGTRGAQRRHIRNLLQQNDSDEGQDQRVSNAYYDEKKNQARTYSRLSQMSKFNRRDLDSIN